LHDFIGFPKALFEVKYPAAGSEWLCAEVKKLNEQVNLSNEWGLDHGTWSVLKNIFPNADVPVVQLSLDINRNPTQHYELAKELNELRKKGVMIIGSGNLVHNFSHFQLKGNDFNEPHAHDWAQEATRKLKKWIEENNARCLCNYKSLGKEIQLSVPTPEHYLPMLYAIAQREADDKIEFFNDVTIGGAFSMLSLILK
jgi:4,5-DOPA dioxygenase extradiol